MSKTLTLRPEVLAFAQEMERRLQFGDRKYGGQTWETWETPHQPALHTDRAATKLDVAVGRWEHHVGHTEQELRAEVVARAADVANYALMTYVLVGAYKTPKTPAERIISSLGDALAHAEGKDVPGMVVHTVSVKADVPCSDAVIERVVNDLRSRSRLGAKKYGVTLEASGLDHVGFLQHAYEEALDIANYLNGAIDRAKSQTQG